MYGTVSSDGIKSIFCSVCGHNKPMKLTTFILLALLASGCNDRESSPKEIESARF